MTDSLYGSSPDMPHRIRPPRRSPHETKTFTNTAGAGFRLSLALNAVGTETALRHEMASADIEIQVIAKKISDFSLMLKQVGKIVEESRTIASPAAIDTVTEIKDQSERDFDEIKSMIEMVQQRDEEGHFRGIEVAQRVTWSFKKRKMQYLLGQLEYLKDSLAIMLQTLQLGQEIADAYEGRDRPPTRQAVEQERAEIQNMIIVQHWSMMELQKLYGLAEQESIAELDSPTNGSPPPSYDASPPGNHLTLTVSGATNSSEKESRPQEEQSESNALIAYQEQPVSAIRDSCERVREREEQALGAQVNDIVDHLLDEWTQVGVRDYYERRRILDQTHRPRTHRPPGSKSQKNKHQAQIESDESDTSEYESDFERSKNIGGYYIEGPRSATKKTVRFRTSVEDEEDEEFKQERKTTKRSVLDRVDESSSSESDSGPPRDTRPPTQHRRTSTSSNGSHAASERQRRPYGRAPYEQASSRPGSRGMAQPPSMAGGPSQPLPQGWPTPMPMPIPSPNPNAWQGPPTPGGLRPGPTYPRMPSNGPYGSHMGPSPGASPVTPQGSYFPAISRGPPPSAGQQQQPNHGPYPPGAAAHPMQAPPSQVRPNAPPYNQPNPYNHHGNARDHDHNRRSAGRKHSGHGSSSKSKKDESNTSKNVKKGILGGTAIAGVMEILQGLDGL